MVAASDTSMALIGSSQSRSFGGTMMARAKTARWHCPTGELGRQRVHQGRIEADQLQCLSDATATVITVREAARRRSPICSPIVSHGVSAATGS